MKTLRFYGYSDDNFAYSVDGRDKDEIGCYNSHAVFIVKGGGTHFAVCGYYCPKGAGGWSIGVAPGDHGRAEVHIPEWPMRFERSEREYSPALVIEAPDDVVVEVDDDPEK